MVLFITRRLSLRPYLWILVYPTAQKKAFYSFLFPFFYVTYCPSFTLLVLSVALEPNHSYTSSDKFYYHLLVVNNVRA